MFAIVLRKAYGLGAQGAVGGAFSGASADHYDRARATQHGRNTLISMT